MRARDEALAKADTAIWNRFTSADFTDVRADGTFMTKADRLRPTQDTDADDSGSA